MRYVLSGILALVFTSHFSPANAQDADDDDFLEISPPEEKFPLFALENLLLEGSTLDRADLKSVIRDTALIDTSRGPIGVCFVDGPAGLVEDVVRFARGWEIEGTSIRFDFGTPATRYCSSDGSQVIRVSFAGIGTWSVVGLEGRYSKGTTMNFSSLENWKLVSERKFKRAVQHEFGHALGLYHEHQHPDAKCEEQIDWQKAGKLYRGKGYNLTDDQIAKNLGRLSTPVATTGFDATSIMIYDLPKAIFHDSLFEGGSSPKCFIGKINYELSQGDRGAASKYYPADLEEVRRQRENAFEQLRIAFKQDSAGLKATAIASVFFPFQSEEGAQPYVDYALSSAQSQ